MSNKKLSKNISSRRQVQSDARGQGGKVFSYYNNAQDKRPPSKKAGGSSTSTSLPQRLVHLIKQLPMILSVTAIIICLGYLLTLTTDPKVVSFTTPRSSEGLLRPTAQYQAAAQQIMRDSILNRTKITIDVDGLEAALRQRFPELSTVAVTLPIIGRRPVVQLQATTPALILTAKDGTSFMIGASGRAIMPASAYKPDGPALPIVRDESGLPIKVGSSALTSSDVNFITTILGQLKAKGITAESLTMPAVAAELRLKPAGGPYYVKFDLNGSARQQVGTFLALKQKLDTDHITPTEYIDVRVNEKAYYK